MAATTRDFDPNRKYKLVLSERLKSGDGTGGYNLSSVQVDADLKIPTKVTSSQIKRSMHDDDEWNLEIKGTGSGEKYVYAGTKQSTKTYALVFDAATQTFTLDRIDTDYSFVNDQSGDGSQSDDGMMSALIEQEGEADPDNPYDWRHHIQRRRTPSPEPLDAFSLDNVGSPSPRLRRERGSRRQASTPPDELSAQSSPKIGSDLELDSEAELEHEPKPEPEQEMDRSDHEFELEVEGETRGKRRMRNRYAEEEDADDDASSGEDADGGGGGLEIIMDGSTRPKWKRGRAFPAQTIEGGPRSLRSAANSRSPAPNIIREDSPMSDRSDDDVPPMILPSPIPQGAVETGASPREEEDIDMDGEGGFDDLEADLNVAFDDDDGDGDGEDGGDEVEMETPGPVPIGQYVEASSSESEAE